MLTSDIIHKWNYLASNDDNCWVWRGWFTSFLLPGGSQTKGAPEGAIFHLLSGMMKQRLPLHRRWEEYVYALERNIYQVWPLMQHLVTFQKLHHFFRTPLCQTENIISLSSSHVKLISSSHFTTFSLFSISDPAIILYLKITRLKLTQSNHLSASP